MGKIIYVIMKSIRFLKDSDVKLTSKLLFLVPIIYFLSPFDLVMDFFPVAGELDDIAVFVAMWPILKNLLEDYETGDYDSKEGKSKKHKDAIDIDDYEID
ncbi:MAG: YkvA family protein [Halanaerobiales bacterium]